MNYVVVIPAHNEAQFLPGLLQSVLLKQFCPLKSFWSTTTQQQDRRNHAKAVETHPNTHYINRVSSNEHLPGAKVVEHLMRIDKITASYMW